MTYGAASRRALEELTAKSVPGLALVVVRDGRPAQTSAAGLADLEGGAAMTPETVQPWFSMTKIVTATAAMQLVESGDLGLDDPVASFLSEFPEPRSGWPRVRVRHLLSHSSGLANPVPVRWVHPASEPGPDPRELALERLEASGRLRFRAGERASYSNVGYMALGEVIAAASGRPCTDQVREQLLEPLSMTRTGFAYDGLGEDAATGYQPRLSPLTPLFRLMLPRGIAGPTAGRFLAFDRFYVDGPAYGGLIGSASDAARFMAAHLNGGELDGVRMLSSESVAAMQKIQVRGRRLEVGLGWNRPTSAPRGTTHLEHLGGGGGFWTMMRIHPDRAVGILAMGNSTRYDHARLARAVLDDTRDDGPPPQS